MRGVFALVALLMHAAVATDPLHMNPAQVLALSQLTSSKNVLEVEGHFYLKGWEKLKLRECSDCDEDEVEQGACDITQDTQCRKASEGEELLQLGVEADKSALKVNVEGRFFLEGWDELELAECSECGEGQTVAFPCSLTHNTECEDTEGEGNNDQPAYNGFLPKEAGTGWKLVRRVKKGDSWHPATDHLRGTHVYGSFQDNPTADATFSRQFDNENFSEYLFTLGDCKSWMIASKEEVAKSRDFDQAPIVKCSSGATTAKWYNRPDSSSDPWLGIEDVKSQNPESIMYIGGGYHYSPFINVLSHNGANVFVR